MRRLRLTGAPALAAALTACFAGCVELHPGGAVAPAYLDDVATAAAAFAATVLCVRAAARSHGSMRRFWSLFAAAVAAWTAGEVAWAVYDLGVGRVPDVSVGDAFYLSAAPLCAAALLVHPSLRGRALGGVRSLADGCIASLSVFLVCWLLVLEPLRHTTDFTSLAGLVSTAYPVTDMVLVVLIVLVARGTTGERRDVWLLLAGLGLMTMADAVYSWLNTVGEFETGGLIDTAWFAGYLALALGALRAHDRSPVAARRRPELSPLALVTPLLTVVVGLGLVGGRLQFGHPLDHVARVAALVLAALVLLRQALLVLDARSGDGVLASRLVGALGDARDGGTT